MLCNKNTGTYTATYTFGTKMRWKWLFFGLLAAAGLGLVFLFYDARDCCLLFWTQMNPKDSATALQRFHFGNTKRALSSYLDTPYIR